MHTKTLKFCVSKPSFKIEISNRNIFKTSHKSVGEIQNLQFSSLPFHNYGVCCMHIVSQTSPNQPTMRSYI